DPSPEEQEEAKNKDNKDSKDKPKKPKTQGPWVIDRYRFKSDTIGYLDRRRTHLYVLDIDKKTTTQITSGDFDDEQPAWSPDGKQIAFTSNRAQPDPDRSYDENVWVVAADNTDKGAHLIQVTTNPGYDGRPSWSTDGKWIAYITQLDPKLLVYATHHLAISPASGGEAKVLTQSFDRMIREPRFSADSKYLYFVADDDGTQNLCRIAVTGGEITRVISGRVVISNYSMARTGAIAAQITTMDRPAEVYTLSSGEPGKPNRLTHV